MLKSQEWQTPTGLFLPQQPNTLKIRFLTMDTLYTVLCSHTLTLSLSHSLTHTHTISRERETQTDRQTDTETDRQTDTDIFNSIGQQPLSMGEQETHRTQNIHSMTSSAKSNGLMKSLTIIIYSLQCPHKHTCFQSGSTDIHIRWYSSIRIQLRWP